MLQDLLYCMSHHPAFKPSKKKSPYDRGGRQMNPGVSTIQLMENLQFRFRQ